MGNIIGEPFKDYVKNQINQRQIIHGKKTRSSKEINYLNSKTSWVKLVSGTKIEMERLDMLPYLSQTQKQPLLGLGLAEKFVLFNGTTSVNESWDQEKMQEARDAGMNMSTNLLEKAGTKIQDTYSKFQPQQKSGFTGDNGAYFSGIGNSKYEFGIVPMPGITNVDIKALEKGSIRRATVTIKAYNKEQFDIIDILYLRLGYTLLLEWGDSHFIKDSEVYSDENIQPLMTTLLEREFFKHGFATTYYNLLDIVESERKKYSGCYDGLVGKISNFKWTFNSDGTYNIVLDVISLGDIIESLKLNIVPYNVNAQSKESTTEKEEDEEDIPLIDSSKDNNLLSRMFYDIKVNSTSVKEGNIIVSDETNPENTTLKVGVQTTRPLYKKEFPKIKIGRGVRIPKKYEFILDDNNLPLKGKLMEYVQIGFCNKSFQWFIRLGNLLESINKLLIFNLKSENGISSPALKIDTDVNTNLMYYIPNMVSTDPRVCIIDNLEIQKPDFYVDKVFGGLNTFKTSFKGVNSSYGNIMNIYVNMNHVLELLSQVDKDGNIVFMEFLRNLCDNISKTLGGVNRLEPKIDPDINTIKIFDLTPLPEKEKLPFNIFPTGSIEYSLDLYGYNKQKGVSSSNFVHNVGLTTEVTPEFATMVTVGATADGYVVGEESTAFSKWNTGIVDRFKESINLNASSTSGSLNEKYLTIATNYFQLMRQTMTSKSPNMENWYSYAGIKLDSTYYHVVNMENSEYTKDLSTFSKSAPYDIIPLYINEENIGTNTKIISEYYKLLQAEAVQNSQDKNKSSGQIGFFPFNLSIDMDGISGIKIYQKLEVNSKFLPTNYPEKLQFVTTNVDHMLKNNAWVTKLNTIATVSNLLDTKEVNDQLKLDLVATKELLQTLGRIDDVFRVKYEEYSVVVPNPGTNRNPIIIQNKSQIIKYQKLYFKQFGNTSTTYANFDNFVIRKGTDKNSYAMKFIKFLGGRDSRIKIKRASNTQPGELGNGADISEKLYNFLINKVHPESMKDKYSSISRSIVITAGNDKFHQGLTLDKNALYPTSNTTPANTTHTRGLALDFKSTRDVGKDNLIIEMLHNAGFGAILYHNPPHIHVNLKA